MVDLQMHIPKYVDFTRNINKTSLSFSVHCDLWQSLFVVVCGTLCCFKLALQSLLFLL